MGLLRELHMETFIVRIYRKNKSEAEDMAGLVEFINSNQEIAFGSLSELVELISDVYADETSRTPS